jgi:hypothetical protein
MDNECQFWRSLALYLAECHAATAESVGGMKSTSAYNKRRLRSICKTAHDAIATGGCDASLSLYWNGKSDARVIDRCARAFDEPIPYTVTPAGKAALRGES